MAKARFVTVSIIVFLLIGCGGSDKKPRPPTPTTGWSIRFGSGMPSQPTSTSLDNWYFDFPATGKGSVNYVTKPHTTPLTGTIIMKFEVAASAATQFDYGAGPENACPTPATVRPYFETKDDLQNEFGRWWAHSVAYELKAGQATLTAPLQPAQWLSVFGKHADLDRTTLDSFNKALQNVAHVGMTFGGGCFYGHGVSVSGGTARFTLLNYEVING